MRWMILVAVAVVGASPALAVAQSAPRASDIPRLRLLYDGLMGTPEKDVGVVISRLNSDDREGLIWLIKTIRAQESETSSYSPPARTSFTPMPRASATTGYNYQPSTVITANPYIGAPISRYDPRVNKYSTDGAYNEYTTGGGRIYAEDGTYLGKLNANKYDPESVTNPYGQYGSKYSQNSINNPYSQYGSKYSTQSARNPYATTPPRVIYGDTARKW